MLAWIHTMVQAISVAWTAELDSNLTFLHVHCKYAVLCKVVLCFFLAEKERPKTKLILFWKVNKEDKHVTILKPTMQFFHKLGLISVYFCSNLTREC